MLPKPIKPRTIGRGMKPNSLSRSKMEKGDIHISEVEFDDSSQAYLVQVSVPVMENGAAIGAITFGINVDEIE